MTETRPSDFILTLPKAELHLHLEGAIEPDTVVELAANHGTVLDRAEVERMFHYTDFAGFLLAFRAITQHLITPDDYELITYRLMQRLASENVLHAEVYISIGVCHLWKRDFDAIFEGLERGRQRGERDFGVSLYWIADAVRHFGTDKAQQVVDHAARFLDRNMIGFGLGGDELRGPANLFGDVYANAASHGLRLTCHAGENTGPESVRDALALNSERIGHGLSCYRDPDLVQRLRDQQVPIEINLTSNIRTGCCESFDHHPLRQYFDQGLLVTLNTDDPGLFETTLAREYQLAQDCYGFTDEELKQLAMNSFRSSFLPEEKKSEFLRRFDAVVPRSSPPLA